MSKPRRKYKFHGRVIFHGEEASVTPLVTTAMRPGVHYAAEATDSRTNQLTDRQTNRWTSLLRKPPATGAQQDGTRCHLNDLEMFHEDGDDDVDEDELRHQHEDDEEHRSDDSVDAAVAHAVGVWVTVVLQRVLPAQRHTCRVMH